MSRCYEIRQDQTRQNQTKQEKFDKCFSVILLLLLLHLVLIFPHSDWTRGRGGGGRGCGKLSLCIWSECGRVRTRMAPGTDYFHVVPSFDIS